MNKLILTSCLVLIVGLVMAGCNQRQVSDTPMASTAPIIPATATPNPLTDDDAGTDTTTLETDLNNIQLEEETFAE